MSRPKLLVSLMESGLLDENKTVITEARKVGRVERAIDKQLASVETMNNLAIFLKKRGQSCS